MNHQEIIDKYRKYEPFFGNWYIKRFIGAGGFANVFEISRKDFGDEYVSALKIISVSMNESDVRERKSQGMTMADIRGDLKNMVEDTIREIKLMYKLRSCPNIMFYEDHTVIESEDGLGCDILIKLELLTPLDAYLLQCGGKLEERTLLKLGIDMCKALEMCQKHKIIHRDIKFENIFVSREGDFKLGDFGIARVIEAKNAGLSKKGTATYMAPEVYKGMTYTSSVDIYSLGMVLYRLLNNNRAPFTPVYPAPVSLDERDEAMMRRMSGEKLPRPNEVPTGRLPEIVLKACVYAPEARYSSPGAMRAELEALLYEKGELSENDTYIRIFDVQNEPEEEDELGVTEVLPPGPGTVQEVTVSSVTESKTTAPSVPKPERSAGRVTAAALEPADTVKKAEKTAPSKGKKKKWLIPAVIVLLLLICGLGYYFATNDFAEIIPEYASKNMKYEKDICDDVVGYALTDVGRCEDSALIIPSRYDGLPVIAIGDYAFTGASFVRSINIPDTVVKIGMGAFNSSKLQSIKLPAGITVIEERTFTNCYSLQTVTLPEKLSAIEDHAFFCCTALESIVIPAGTTEIAEEAFYKCTNISEIYFENPQGWYLNSRSWEYLDLSDPARNAELFTRSEGNAVFKRDTNFQAEPGREPEEAPVPENSGQNPLRQDPKQPTPTMEPDKPEPTRPAQPDEPEPTRPPKPTATNTPKPTATNTPKPTATNTPKPTATPTPATFTSTTNPELSAKQGMATVAINGKMYENIPSEVWSLGDCYFGEIKITGIADKYDIKICLDYSMPFDTGDELTYWNFADLLTNMNFYGFYKKVTAYSWGTYVDATAYDGAASTYMCLNLGSDLFQEAEMIFEHVSEKSPELRAYFYAEMDDGVNEYTVEGFVVSGK